MGLRDTFIGIYLVVQVLLPLSYYTVRESPYDARFSGRMFSDVRMLRCTASYTRDGAAVKLSQEFHMAWNTLVQRGRSDVIAAVSQEICGRAGQRTVRLELECREADGTRSLIFDGTEDICQQED